MIITKGKLITSIHYKNPNYIADSVGNEYSHQIAAIYKGSDLIWLTSYQVSIKSCYGSGQWLDNYNWVEDTWKD